MREKSCFPQRHKHLIIASQHFLACLRVYLARDCESKNSAEMLTEEGLKKSCRVDDPWSVRGDWGNKTCFKLCFSVEEHVCICILQRRETMGKGQATLLAQASLRGVNRSRQGPVARTHTHIHANVAKAAASHPR